MNNITETDVERLAIDLLEGGHYQYAYGPDIAPDGNTPERQRYDDVILEERLRKFIHILNPDIPYSLLGFSPHFYFRDMPPTSRRHAEDCKEAALEAGLKRVRLGNIHLLGKDY